MYEFIPEQARIVARLDRAMKDAARAGLAMRVFDGHVLMMRLEALRDPRYGEFGLKGAEWIAECTRQIGHSLEADGGAGV